MNVNPAQPRLPFPGAVEISVSRATKLLGCSRNTVYRLLSDGSLAGYQWRPGGWWRIYYDSLVRFSQLRRGVIPGSESRAAAAADPA